MKAVTTSCPALAIVAFISFASPAIDDTEAMFNLKDVELGNLRGYSLHLLKMRGVFDTTLSRYRLPGDSKKASVRDLDLSKEAIAEIEWRFESLKPYLKPGKFAG